MIWSKKLPKLKVLLICDPSLNAKPQHEDAVWGIGGLELVDSVSLYSACDRIKNTEPDLIWLEFSPEPIKAMNLFNQILQDFPKVHFILSDSESNQEFLELKEKSQSQFFILESDWRFALPMHVKRARAKLRGNQS